MAAGPCLQGGTRGGRVAHAVPSPQSLHLSWEGSHALGLRLEIVSQCLLPSHGEGCRRAVALLSCHGEAPKACLPRCHCCVRPLEGQRLGSPWCITFIHTDMSALTP